MKRRIWAAALAAGLGGVLAQAPAQQAVWRPAPRPRDFGVARATAPGHTGASLGRPVPITRGAAGDAPRPFPEQYGRDALPARTITGGVEPIATVPPPGAVIAVSAPAQLALPAAAPEALDAGLAGDLFAQDRPPPGAVQVGYAEPQKVGNWQGTFPVTAPPPQHVAEAPAVPLGFGEELPPTKWYARGEALVWWMKNAKTPPLVTTTRVLDPTDDDVGRLDQPDTVVLAGGNLVRDDVWGGRYPVGG
jgi:hypothetical protein